MKFQPETVGQGWVVQAYDSNGLVVNGQRFEHSLIFGSQLPPQAWPDGLDKAFTLDSARWIHGQCPEGTEVLLVGTGAKQVFPGMDIRRFFLDLRCPVEYMDSQAAARTYNILMAEGRQVIAALML